MIDIDALKRDKRPQSSTLVHALIDRLEAAESEALEEARLNGMGGERELALMAKLEAAEKTNREWLRANAPGGWIDNLRAKITEMEKQEPAGEVVHNGESAGLYDILKQGTLLYTIPGAQPTPSVPDGWRLVPIVSTHEMKEAGACAGAVYYAIAKDVWSAMLAAAPEAKP